MHTKRSLAMFLATGLVACGPAETTAPLPIVPFATDTYTDIEAEPLQDDILWSVRMPGDFNGTLLVHSRGWSPVAGEPGVAPRQHVDSLLAQGYALAASNYGAGGWSVAEAVPAQELVVAEFSKRYTTPNRVIAFGYSMGGLVTTALVEKNRSSRGWRHCLLQFHGRFTGHDEHGAGWRLGLSHAGCAGFRDQGSGYHR